MEISAVMVAIINMFRSRLDDSNGDMSKCAVIIAENIERLCFIVFVVYVISIVFDIFA
jgi:hypothetical protein